MTTILVAGGRDVENYATVKNGIEAGLKHFGLRGQVKTVVQGGCRGTDRLATSWALENEAQIVEFPADWNTHGKAAGPIRNRQMASYTKAHNGFVILIDSGGRGTQSMRNEALALNLPVFTYYLGEE